MRKRSDASKTPVTQRSATRNSAAARRGEERSVAASKEQSKLPGTVTKAAEEKASEAIREIVSPRRSSAKRETSLVLETLQSTTADPLSNDATLPEILQAQGEALLADTSAPTETTMAGTNKPDSPVEIPVQKFEKEALSIKVCTEQMEKQAPFLEISVEGMDKQAPISDEQGMQKQVSSAETKQILEMSRSNPNEADLGSETLARAPSLGILEAGKLGKPEAGQPDVSRVGKPNVSEIGLDDVPQAKLLDVSEAVKTDLTEAGEGETGRSLSETRMEISSLDLSQAPEAGDQSNELGINCNFQTDKGETTGQEQESVTKSLDLTVDPSPVLGGEEKVMPPKDVLIYPAQLQGEKDEANHTQLTAATHPLSSETDEHAPQFMGSIQQFHIAQPSLASEGNLEPAAATENTQLTELIQGKSATFNEIANIALGRVGASALEVDRTAYKASTSYEASSFSHLENNFTQNMVSSVEGETVLIVESLGVLPQAPTKLENTLSGTVGSAIELRGQPKETETKVKTEGMLEVGKDLVGRKVIKRFGDQFFEGKVAEYEPQLNWYKVVYEDGDEEELDLNEVRKLLPEVDYTERSDKTQHGVAIGSTNSLKRNIGTTSPAASNDAMQEDGQLQDRVKLRSLKRRHVIDTSNDINAYSDDQIFSTSEESSEDEDDDDDDDETVGGKRRSRKKPKGKFGSGKRRRKVDKKADQKEFTVKLNARLKEDKSQDTSTEHRIATRRSTGVLSTHMTSSEDHSLSSLKKAHTELQDRMSFEVHSSLRGAKLVGRKTRKDFGGEFYYGQIIHYDNRAKYYKVQYEDGDEEELEWAEVAPTLLPPEKVQSIPTVETSQEAASRNSQARTKDHSKKVSTVKGKEVALIPHDPGTKNGDLTNSTRKWRKRVRTASVSGMMKGTDNWNATLTISATASEPPPRPLAAVRFASASDADVFEYFGWGEVVNFDRSKCPELRATRLLPTSSPVVHLAASRHHLVALTATGQVWVWRCKHGNIRTRCNEWEHVAMLDNRNIILVDISGPDVDRASAGYQPEQEDQVPDPFYLSAVRSNGEDIILQGSQPHESVHTYQYDSEPRHPGLREAVLESNPEWLENMGRIVQVSVGIVEAPDESPFVGYITDTDCVFIRSATRDFMEEVNLVTGYTGKPLKIQCGRVYHAIILTDDGRAWTWGQGYYPGSNVHSAGFASKWASPFSVCQPAVGTLVGRKVVDVGCYGEDFVALTNDGDVHQWTHALPNPAAGVYNVPATPVYGQRPSIGSGDKLKQVTIGAGICAGISESGKVHTWRTSLKGGFAGVVGVEREAATPLGREEGTETAVLALGTRAATKVMCVAGSLLVVVKRKYRGRRGGKRKLDASALKGKSPEDEGDGDGDGDCDGED